MTVPASPSSGVEAQTHGAITSVRDAFAEVIAHVPAPTRRPHEVEKALHLHKTLAWKLSKVVDGTDLLTIFQHIPGPAAVRKILRSAEALGVDPTRSQRVHEALQVLDAVVREHAGDRHSFETMLAGFDRRGRRETDLAYRKMGFQSTSYIWGVQASTILRTVIFHPDQDRMLDAAVLFGCVQLKRMHAESPWVIGRYRPTDDRGRAITTVREPIDPTEDGDGPLLREFSSTSAILRRRVGVDDAVEDELEAGPIGNAGSVTCFTGEVLRRVMPGYVAEANDIIAQNLEVRTPCRTVIFDHLVPHDLFGRVEPQLRVFGELAGRPLYVNLRSDRDRLDVFEEVEYLGRGPAVMTTTEIPRYDEMVSHVCARCWWDAGSFDVYRLRMEFPYVPSTITYSYPLPHLGT